jgi:hypothetical protein
LPQELAGAADDSASNAGGSAGRPSSSPWRIDDHSTPHLVATQPATRSTVTVAILRSPDVVGRSQCEDLARLAGLLPSAPVQKLEDEVAMVEGAYDTRILVAIQPGAGPHRPLAGHVMAVGGYLRKCFVFRFTTEVDSADDEPALSARLAFARARILGGMTLDRFGVVPRRTELGPGDGPIR